MTKETRAELYRMIDELRSDNEVLLKEAGYRTIQIDGLATALGERESDLEAAHKSIDAWEDNADEQKAALESARAELAEAYTESGCLRADADEAVRSNKAAMSMLETARALAMEEAARLMERRISDPYSETWGPFRSSEIRALAPLPASLVVVPVGTLAKVREALEHSQDHQSSIQVKAIRAALALLDEVSK